MTQSSSVTTLSESLVTISVNRLAQGGGGADAFAISAAIATASTINGNAGHDSIVLSASPLLLLLPLWLAVAQVTTPSQSVQLLLRQVQPSTVVAVMTC